MPGIKKETKFDKNLLFNQGRELEAEAGPGAAEHPRRYEHEREATG
jgi:hypothetical protein